MQSKKVCKTRMLVISSIHLCSVATVHTTAWLEQ